MARRSAKLKPPRQAPQAKYDAAGVGRRLAKWRPPSSGPNAAMQGLQTVRDRARDAGRNDWAGAAGALKWGAFLIGVGIVPRFNRVPEGPQRDRVVDLWNDFVRNADADSVLDFYGMQTLGERTRFEAGEFYVRRRDRPASWGLRVPMQVQMLEPDMVPLWDADAGEDSRIGVGNTVRSGIERDKRGRRVAIWFHKEHPGEKRSNSGIDPTGLVRVRIEEVRQVYFPHRVGALRGVPAMAAVLTRLRNSADFEDAALERQKLANLYVAYITRQIPEEWDGETDPETGLPVWYDQEGRAVRAMEPGTVTELLPGESVTMANPPEAGVAYPDYLRTVNMGTAAATGMPYELLSGDIRGVSDRTLRVMILELRRLAQQMQWQVIIPQMCQTVVEWFVDAAVLAGEIPRSLADAARRVEWSPHGWEHIHPVQDPQGKIMEIEAGLRSRSSVIGERGDDRGTVDRERQDDMRSEERRGLVESPAPPAPAPGPSMLAEATRLVEAMAPRQDVLMAALERPAPAAPVLHVHIPQTQVDVQAPTVSVAAPAVHVTNEVPAAEVKVEVQPAEVHVTNEVKPADVRVELPERETTSVIERDASGQIVNVTQTERTLN